MVRLRCSGGWSNTVAWMVDKNGTSVSVENHVQKGEDTESQLDEYGLACAYRYAEVSGDKEYLQAACVLIQAEVLDNLFIDDPDDELDFREEVASLCDSQNVSLYLKALQLPELTMTCQEFLDLCESRGIDDKVDAAQKALRTLFERLMMRVRVGGIINTPTRGSTDIYFRIPDTTANGWYTAIGNFLYDHPQYAGFALHIYEEAGSVGQRQELESYSTAKQFLDLKSCKAPEFKGKRLNSAYRRRDVLNARFVQSLGGR